MFGSNFSDSQRWRYKDESSSWIPSDYHTSTDSLELNMKISKTFAFALLAIFSAATPIEKRNNPKFDYPAPMEVGKRYNPIC